MRALGFAFLPWGGGGLIAGNILGNAASTFSLCRRIWKEEKGKKYPVCRVSLLKAAGRYRKFPQFSVAGGLLNTISLQMPAILLAWLYSPVVLGYYAIVDRILCLPTTLISTAIADVFRQRASDEYRRNKDCRRLLLRSTLSLLLFGLPPFCLIAAFGPSAFAFVFGETWRDAGVYARLLAVMFLFRFAFAPMSGTVIQITERLEIDTIWQSVLLVLSFLSIFVRVLLFPQRLRKPYPVCGRLCGHVHRGFRACADPLRPPGRPPERLTIMPAIPTFCLRALTVGRGMAHILHKLKSSLSILLKGYPCLFLCEMKRQIWSDVESYALRRALSVPSSRAARVDTDRSQALCGGRCEILCRAYGVPGQADGNADGPGVAEHVH